MKISAVEAIPLRYPFRHGGPPSGWGGGAWTEMRTLLVRVETDAGLTGWGEAFGYNAIPATRAALETMVAPLAVGRDAGDIASLMRDLQRELHLFGRYGVTCFALSGLDIALWDLAGKAAGEPLHRLARVPRNSVPTDAGVEQVEQVLDAAGDTARDSVPAYASLLKYGDPALVARLVGKALEEGYERVKLHESTVAPVAAAREAAGADTPIMLDVNCVWSPVEARRMAREMDEFALHWLEEPLWPPENFDALASLRMEADAPLAAGENACTAWQFAAMFEAGAVDYAQPSVTKVGGVSEFRKVAVLAGQANVALAPHSPYFGPGFLATLQLLAADSSVEAIERFYVTLDDDLYGGALTPRNGAVAVPDGPGLGLEPDPGFIERWRER